MKITVKDREPFELADQFYVNPNGWFKTTWLIETPFSNAISHQFVVEANHEGDAIDILLDSKFGHLYLVDEQEMDEYEKEYRETGKEIDWDLFEDWLADEKDCVRGGNNGKLYHSDQFMVGCINRCVVEEFNYEDETE